MEKEQHDSHQNKMRILVVDHHAVTRRSLIKLFETECGFMVFSEAENAEQAMKAIARQEFDLAIVDISMEGTNGLELIKKMKLSHPDMSILVFSMPDGHIYSRYAISAGASGYVSKCEEPENIINAIRHALNENICTH